MSVSTSPNLPAKAGAGFLFGSALTLSRVYVPSVIMSQMQLKDFHMMVAFLCASAGSAAVMAAFDSLEIAPRQPRSNSTMRWFGPYDANIVGGALIGIGMATTGACPGTVIVQVAAGVKSGIYVAVGGLMGGILYARFGKYLKRNPPTTAATTISSKSESGSKAEERHHTIYAHYSLSPNTVLLAYEIMCLAMISASALLGLDKNAPWLHPILGGSLIGAAQASTLLLTGSPVGVSAAYGEAGEYFWYLFSPKGPLPRVSALTFAAGIFAGTLTMAWMFPLTLPTEAVSPTIAVLGGCTMIIGARLAGGCTSGHGISGMSSFSIASVISVAAMFGAGIGTALMIG